MTEETTQDTAEAATPEPEMTRAITAVPVIRDEAAELQTVMRWGKLMDASGLFPDSKSIAQAAVKILAGRELGFGVMESMTGVHFIDGKPTLGAHLLASGVKRSTRYDYRVIEHTDTRCVIQFFEYDARGQREKVGESSFSLDDAVAARLTDSRSGMWQKYPRNMLFSRAMSNGIRWYCPDVFSTLVYTPDELRPDIVLDESGDILDVESIAVPPRQEERRQDQAERGGPPQGGRGGGGQNRQQSRGASAPKQPPKTYELADVVDVQSLMQWAHNKFKADSRGVCDKLELPNLPAISAKYHTPEEWQEAALEVWHGFDPEEHERHMAAIIDADDAAQGEYEQAPDGEADVTEASGPEASE